MAPCIGCDLIVGSNEECSDTQETEMQIETATGFVLFFFSASAICSFRSCSITFLLLILEIFFFCLTGKVVIDESQLFGHS